MIALIGLLAFLSAAIPAKGYHAACVKCQPSRLMDCVDDTSFSYCNQGKIFLERPNAFQEGFLDQFSSASLARNVLETPTITRCTAELKTCIRTSPNVMRHGLNQTEQSQWLLLQLHPVLKRVNAGKSLPPEFACHARQRRMNTRNQRILMNARPADPGRQSQLHGLYQ